MTEKKQRVVATESFVERFAREAAEREKKLQKEIAERKNVTAEEEGEVSDGPNKGCEG